MKRLSPYQISAFITRRKTKSSCYINKSEISAPTWHDKFELPDGSYSVTDIQDYFEYILKKYGENTGKSSVQIYVNKTENRITLKLKMGIAVNF